MSHRSSRFRLQKGLTLCKSSVSSVHLRFLSVNRLGVFYGFTYYNGVPTEPMSKFTFRQGEREQTFTAVGAHYYSGRYLDYEITGNWSSDLLEDGKVPMELKITYGTTDWGDIGLRGVFDPEENSLRGITDLWEGVGEFVFKRDPDFVRLYPAPSVINARRRWVFALQSILDRVRHQAWSSKQIFKRLKGRKRFTELTLRLYYGEDWAVEEVEEYYGLLPGLYEADAQFYASVINMKLSNTVNFK